MAIRQVFSLEGNATTGELGGIPGEATVDGNSPTLASPFDLEPGSSFMAGGVQSLMQRIYIEADTQGQSLQVFAVIDGVDTLVGTMVSTGKAQADFGVNLTGYIHSARVFIPTNTLTKRIEVSAIELDLYRP